MGQNMAEKLKVAVLTGGISRERDISFQSGRLVADAIEKASRQVVSFDIGPDNLSILDDDSIDVFFPAIHGTFGEDGQLQEILRQRGLCYTGSGPQASRMPTMARTTAGLIRSAIQPKSRRPGMLNKTVNPRKDAACCGVYWASWIRYGTK